MKTVRAIGFATLLLSLALPLRGDTPGSARAFLVICSPGSPGSTLEAQPTMDAFAAAAGTAAGWPVGDLGAVYFETAEAGRDRLSKTDAALALVSPPFYARYAKGLSLQAKLEAVPESGAGEIYSLVVKKGAVASSAALSGWEITGGAGFAPDFVRSAVLGDWGGVPKDARITFSARPLSGLRRAANGEQVAVLLNKEQAAALPTLPFAGELEVAHHSRAFPSGVLCVLPGRLPSERARSLLAALVAMKDDEKGRAALKSIQLEAFAPVDPSKLPVPSASPVKSEAPRP